MHHRRAKAISFPLDSRMSNSGPGFPALNHFHAARYRSEPITGPAKHFYSLVTISSVLGGALRVRLHASLTQRKYAEPPRGRNGQPSGCPNARRRSGTFPGLLLAHRSRRGHATNASNKPHARAGRAAALTLVGSRARTRGPRSYLTIIRRVPGVSCADCFRPLHVGTVRLATPTLAGSRARILTLYLRAVAWAQPNHVHTPLQRSLPSSRRLSARACVVWACQPPPFRIRAVDRA